MVIQNETVRQQIKQFRIYFHLILIVNIRTNYKIQELMNPQKPQSKPFTGNPFAHVIQKKTENTNNPTNNTQQTTNTQSFPTININQSYPNTVSTQNQPGNLGTKANPYSIEKSESNYTEKTSRIVDLTKINQSFKKKNNPAENAFKDSLESDNIMNNPSSSPKTGSSNMAKKSTKRPNQREEIIVVDELQTKNTQTLQAASESQRNKVFSNNTQPIIISPETESKAIIISQPNINKSTPAIFKNNSQPNPPFPSGTNLIIKPIADNLNQIKQTGQMANNMSASSQLQNNSTTNAMGVVGQIPSTVQTTSNGVSQSNMIASFKNTSQPPRGQTSSNSSNVLLSNTQSKFLPTTTSNSNLTASRVVGSNNYQSTNGGNAFTKNITNSQTQSSNQHLGFTKFQNNNTTTNQSTTSIPSSNTITANQNQSTNFNQVQNTFPLSNNQNPLAQLANQNENPQLNPPTNYAQGVNQTESNGINLHYIQDMTADQYYQKTKALNVPPTQYYQTVVKKLKQKHQKENDNMDLHFFLNECIQNLQYIYGGLEELSTRPAILIDQFERNKILKSRCNQLQTTLALQPHKMLVKIKKMDNKIAESLIFCEKMQSKMQEQLEHHLSIAIKEQQEINDEIQQQALDLPSEGEHDLIKIYNYLTSIDSELTKLNQTADHYIRLLQKQ